jgi:15-cis-phytoene synthase
MNQDEALLSSYRLAQRIAARSGSSFYRSFALLPTEKRRGMETFYAFARLTDDLADDHHPTTARPALEAWEQCIVAAIAADDAGRLAACDRLSAAGLRPPLLEEHVGILPAIAQVATERQIQSRWLLDLVAGAKRDLQPEPLQTVADVQHYCYLVAGTVGLACTRIWGAIDDGVILPAKRCGEAFQQTNILRDLQEDRRAGRCYVSIEDLTAHGIDWQSWMAGRVDRDARHALINALGDRAMAAYRDGWSVHSHLPADSRMMFGLMFRTYRALLETILRHRDRAWERRAQVGWLQRISLLASHAIPALRWRLKDPP